MKSFSLVILFSILTAHFSLAIEMKKVNADSTSIVSGVTAPAQQNSSAALHPDTLVQRIVQARRLMNEYKFDSAIDTLERAFSQDSSSIELARELENIYFRISQKDKALEFVNRLLEFGIDSSVCMPHKALIFKNKEELTNSLAIFQKLEQKDSTNTFFLNQIADIYTMRYMNDSALYYYTKSVKISPKSSTILNAGQLLLKKEREEDALNFLDKYYNPEVHDSKPLQRLYGQIFYLLNNFKKSIEVFNELYQNGDSSFITAKFLGMSYRKDGDYLNAEQPLRLAASQNPNDFLVYYNLGICCRSLGMVEESEKHLFTAMNIITASPSIQNMIYRELAITYKRSGRWTDALEMYYTILETDPFNISVRMDISSILDDQLKDKDRAIESYKKALAVVEKDSSSTQYPERMKKYLNQRIDKLEEKIFWEEGGNTN
jgi:tetratricopeptide (TPR) repeat protein